MEPVAVFKVLNELIHTSNEGMNGFAEAASKATDEALKIELQNRADLCGEAARDLQSLVRMLGSEPEEDAISEARLHPGWVSVNAATGRVDAEVLAEVERDGVHAKAVYRHALDEDLPVTARQIVKEQYEHVLRTHDRIRDLRSGYKRAA